MTIAEQKRFYQLLGERIKNARVKNGLKQETFAQLLSKSRVSIVNIEKGRQHPPLHLLWNIAKVLKVNIIDLLPDFSSPDKSDDELRKIVTKQFKGNKETKEKLLDFIGEVQSKTNIS